MKRSLLALAIACAGCAGGGGSGPLAVTALTTPDGLPRISLGSCVGFTIVGNGVVFAPDATVTLGPMDAVPVRFVDETHLRVGSDETGGTCVWTPIFADPGAWTLTVTSAGASNALDGAIFAEPPVIHDAGAVDHSHVWSDALGNGDGANELERPYDVDLYRVAFSESYHVYDHVDFFSTGTNGTLVPQMEIWDPAEPAADLGRGGESVVFPKGGEMIVAVRDVSGAGGPGARYDLAFTGDELGTGPDADKCDGNVPVIGDRAYHVDYDPLHDDLDPDGNCKDSIYGDPIHAPGNDAVWYVVVPAGQQLRVATYDDHIDNVVYLLPAGAGCQRRPPLCLAAAGHFGGGNTDTLVWRNTTGVDQELLLVHDSAKKMAGHDVGSFLVDVELFP
jgi:hypothetical protein